MAFQSVVRHGRAKAPDLDALIQTATGKGVGVLGVELDLHDVVLVALKVLRALEVLVPVPELDGHVVGAAQNVRQGGVHLQVADVVLVRFHVSHLLHGVVVVHSESHVVRRRDEPLLASDELGAADGKIGQFEGLYAGRAFVVPNHDVSRVEGGEGPWFCGVDVHRFHSVRLCRELFLDV